MTVWKPSVETVALRRLPKTVRGWQNYELKQAPQLQCHVHHVVFNLSGV